MDIDPLAETVPPRHAIESDEEDEYNPLPTRGTPLDHVFEIKFIPDNLREGEHLVIAAGDIAKYWAHGADLGEQIGAIYGNKVSIGLVFNPKWTKSTVIVSEVLARLPVWAMHSYVTAILDALKPIKLALLDTYPTHAYISDKPVSFEDAPIRYLATQSAGNLLNSKAEPFAPPNLIQSTSASFLSMLSVLRAQTPGSLILVPSPHIPSPAPKVLEHNNFSHFDEDPVEWTETLMNLSQELLFGLFGETVPRWTHDEKYHDSNSSKRKRSDVGEGGMYI